MPARRVVPVAGPLDAVVAVPGSKSVANRALVCAALAPGTSHLDNLPGGDDTEAMLDCLQRLGMTVTREPATVSVAGGVGRMVPGPITLPARLAGTTSRFVTALAALGPGPYTVDGGPPLRARPMAPLHDALAALGARMHAAGEWGHLPVEVAGPLTGGGVRMRGDVSSQYISALMMVAPLLPGGLTIELTTELVSRPYLAITASVMAAFGATGVHVGDRDVRVEPGEYSARRYEVEPDASSASYPLAAAAIAGGRVRVPGLTSGSLQGDAGFAQVLAGMGCTCRVDATGTTVERSGPLHGVDIDMVDLSDLAPTLAVVAVFADSPTRVRGVGFIRGKESDRIGDLCAELRAAGVDAADTDDGFVITPGAALRPARLGTHHDHRLAMALALLGLRSWGIEIDDPEVVSKSWPGYWTMIDELR